MRECTPEVGMSIFRVLLDHAIEVQNGLLMLVDHLIGLRSFVDISNVALNQLNTFGEGEDRLLELFLVAVCQTNVVVEVGFVG